MMQLCTSQVFACSTIELDKSLNVNVHPEDIIKSNDYSKNKEVIREQLVCKLNRMIINDNYDNILFYLFFVVDISDERYLDLLTLIENRIGSYAGINIKGYSKFLKLKNSKVAKNTMIEEIVKPDIGVYLLDDVSKYIFYNCDSFDDKLVYFKKIYENVKYDENVIILKLLNQLCSENVDKTITFISNDKLMSEQLKIDCKAVKDLP